MQRLAVLIVPGDDEPDGVHLNLHETGRAFLLRVDLPDQTLGIGGFGLAGLAAEA